MRDSISEASLPEPSLRFAFEASVALAPVHELGTMDGMRKRIVPILGGAVTGPRLNGQVLPGGADWQGISADLSVTRAFAHYWLQADDGAIISVQNVGVRVADPAIVERMLAGETIAPGDYYFRTCPVFEVGEGPHDWLTRTLFICVGARLPDAVVIRFYEVL